MRRNRRKFTVHATPTPLPFLSFFFNDTATTEIYTLSLHDALPILAEAHVARSDGFECLGEDRAALRKRQATQVAAGEEGRIEDEVHDVARLRRVERVLQEDRKSTRLNSSHSSISYAVFCLKKKTKK